jgi:hypothetical protein
MVMSSANFAVHELHERRKTRKKARKKKKKKKAPVLLLALVRVWCGLIVSVGKS